MDKSAVARNYAGTRDYFADDARWRRSIMETIREVYELFGFEELQTPMIERDDVLRGKYGQEGETRRFRLSLPFPDEAGLRYDHTVPLARFMGQNWNKVVMPYRRYSIGPVFRNETVQKGRDREFVQMDFDTIGSESLVLDAEIAAINYMVLSKLGFNQNFIVLVNDRKLLDAMLSELGDLSRYQKIAILRAWDKLAKVGTEKALLGLVDDFAEIALPQSGSSDNLDELDKNRKEYASGIEQGLRDMFIPVTEKLLSTDGMSTDRVLSRLSTWFSSKESQDAIRSCEKLINTISAMGVPSQYFRLDPTLARGLDYYTGPIFETIVTQANIGSISGGGRYDNLISDMGGPNLTGTGSSFGLERLMPVMETIGLKPSFGSAADIFIAIYDQGNVDQCNTAYQIANILRLTDYRVEVYTGNTRKLAKQIEVANKKHIPIVVIIAPDEVQNNTVTIKSMNATNETQITVPVTDLVSAIEKLLTE